MLAIIAALAVLLLAITATAQSRSTDPTPALIRSEVDFREWTLRYAVDVLPLNPVRGEIRNGRRVPTRTPQLILTDAAFVFPIIRDTGWTIARNSLIRGEVRAQRNRIATDFTTIPNFQGPSSVGVWRLGDINTSSITFEVDIPMRSYRLNIDESRAISQYPWPSQPYPPDIAINLDPQLFVQSDHPAIRALLSKWLGGRSPRAVPPYRLAKYLAGRVTEHVQPNGSGLSFGGVDNLDQGGGLGLLSGFECFGAAYAAHFGKGSPHDLANLLCAVYRAAGLPARLTIVADTQRLNTPDGIGAVRAFVEFYLYNETLDFGEWIPVDIQRQREFSSEPPALDQRWEHFGHIEEGTRLAPIAHHWHPPAGVLNAGPPALWGWVTAPAIPLATQHVRLTAVGTPRDSMEGEEDGHIALRDLERGNQR